MASVVMMGVAGCGKSTLGASLAHALQCPLIEGDEFHAPSSREKMRRGVPLSDADRAGWLDALAGQLRLHPNGVVLTCSALKRRYRDRLRAAAPDLRFVYLQLDEATALERVAARAGTHLFPTSLVASQFAALEPPTGEPRVLTVDATLPVDALADTARRWLRDGAVDPS